MIVNTMDNFKLNLGPIGPVVWILDAGGHRACLIYRVFFQNEARLFNVHFADVIQTLTANQSQRKLSSSSFKNARYQSPLLKLLEAEEVSQITGNASQRSVGFLIISCIMYLDALALSQYRVPTLPEGSHFRFFQVNFHQFPGFSRFLSLRGSAKCAIFQVFPG